MTLLRQRRHVRAVGQVLENHAGNINDISVYGQIPTPTTWKMAQMNLAIRGIDADLGKYNADTFFNDYHPPCGRIISCKPALQPLQLGRG